MVRKRFDLIAGRKLLLADDSVAIQKVIDLTFTDEGMEVTTVGNGQHAWDKLDQFVPDVVLADVFMPGIDGYGLCERIKQNERFGGIPVILLVGSFEPFDEAEARRVGADDVVTKPFQSIRQLVSRVGSLVGGKTADAEESRQVSTLGLETPRVTIAKDPADQPNVTVLVEAPAMTNLDSSNVAEKSCAEDIELQTADTMQLPSVETATSNETPQQDEFMAIADSDSDEKINSETFSIGAREMNDTSNQQMVQPDSTEFNDTVLDLDDFGKVQASTAEDFILDLEPEAASGDAEGTFLAETSESPVIPLQGADIIELDSAVETETARADEGEEWPVVPASVLEEPARSASQPGTEKVSLSDLSPEAVDAIARRAVEHLSEKVVREIAWEVVPELAELLIKRRLDEKK